VSLIIILGSVIYPKTAQADPLTTKSVTVGSSLPGANTTHRFIFTLANVSPVGSIEFEYCINTPFVGTPCTPPTGFTASAASLQSQTGETGFSIHPNTTSNRIVLSRLPVATSAVPVTYNFDNIVNQSTTNSTSFVRIASFASDDGTGPRTDEGAVAYSTSSALSVEGYVPPYIIFCVGVTVNLNCTNTNGTLLSFGELTPLQPRFLSSQFSVATNDPGGYATFVSGPTMTSGNNIIPALESPRQSQSGSSQFGMNLRANSNPAVGSNPQGVGSGAIATGFNTPNQFFFRNQLVASSTISSDFNAFTVSYIVNIAREQQPGIYSTTLTYIASAAF
jgi:hypothetical protein